jgi:hypothetical protein
MCPAKTNLTPFLLALAVSALSTAASATEPAWPPPPEVQARMRELQQVVTGRESTREQRDEARAELGRLMRSPSAAGPMPHTRPRAAIEPAAPVKAVAVPLPPGPPPEVGKLEVVVPSRFGTPAAAGPLPAPIGTLAIDPRTGHVIQKTPAGYVDTTTGQPVPR